MLSPMRLARRTTHSILALAAITVLAGCPGSPNTSDADAAADAVPIDVAADDGIPPVPMVRMDFTNARGFYDSPFPNESRRDAMGRPNISGFPNPQHIEFVDQLLAMARRDVDGFSTTSAIFFALTVPIDTMQLPDLHGSRAATSIVQLVDVDRASPALGQRIPLSVRFLDDSGPFGTRNHLVALPLQGYPLRPNTRYAAVVRRAIRARDGRGFEVHPSLVALLRGDRPDGMSAAAFDAHREALDVLRTNAVDPTEIVGLTVFRTSDPTAGILRVREAAMRRSAIVPVAPLTRREVFPEYCVYASTVRMPVYQQGVPPYGSSGGGWAFDPTGAPVFRAEEEANLVVTVPRRTMPAGGFPVAVFIRTGGGGERPLVDRGVQAFHGGPSLTPGTGPALEFARAGFAGLSVDGPHGGLRNITHSDEQFLMFNIANPTALRDNVRQSALEISLVPRMLETLTIDASDCPGVVSADNRAHFDVMHVALMGHSMGGTIAPLALAAEPRFRAGILSGAGGSLIENVVYKRSPVPVRPIAEILLRYSSAGRMLHEHDPVLSLLQWMVESSDSPVYARLLEAEPTGGQPRHLYVIQGIVDTYILPPIANAFQAALGIDLVGPALDMTHPDLQMFTPLVSLLDLHGRTQRMFPVRDNIVLASGARATAVVAQHPSDGIEDGHETAFQTEAPKAQYRCFLETFAADSTTVFAVRTPTDPCM